MVEFCEGISGAIWLKDLTPILSRSTDFQKINYYQSREFGRILVLNNELQHVEAWAPIYHEITTHLPCSFIENPIKSMVMGGGSLYIVEELMKYESIECIDLVEYDLEVIKATINVYPERKKLLKDKRLNIINRNCIDYIQSNNKKYDIIINDCFNLYEEDKYNNVFDFYAAIELSLTNEGIFSDLIYRSIYDNILLRKAIVRVPMGLNLTISLLAVPEYPGIMHALTMWGKNKNLSQEQKKLINLNQIRMNEAKKYKIYSPNNISFYLYCPPYLCDYIK